MLLSRKEYSNWREIQDEYYDYMASLDFETLADIENYIKMDYKVTSEKAKREINRITETSDETIEIEI